MHPYKMCARSTTQSPWSRRVWEVIFCLGCLVAGATLVGIAMPVSRTLSAGASVGQTVPSVGLLDFTATWCGPCQQMSPVVEGLQRQGYPVYKVDVDQRPDLVRQFRITGMPTFVLVVNGQEAMRQTGATSESQLKRMLLQIPELQKVAQATRPAAQSTAIASADPDFGPTAPVDLGSPAAEVPRAVAGRGTPNKPKLSLPFFNRDKDARERTTPERSPVDFAAAEFRGQNPEPAATNGVAVADPLRASTQLRVKDKTGVNYGSGTIIHSRIGRTLVLTCGHIFKNTDESRIVEVDVFGRGRQPQTHIGKVLHYDPVADIGVVAIPTQETLPAIPVAALDRQVSKGDAVLSIGCNGVETPSRESVEVTALNFYEGPESLQCTGFPVQGRSGGGLFRGQELVGVCIAADPIERRGVYTALAPIYELLTKAGCSQSLPTSRPAPTTAVASTAQPAAASTLASTDIDATLADAARAFGVSRAADDLETAFAQSPDAEVICIVRPRDPKAASRTVIIHQATPKLVGYLLDSLESPTTPASTLAQTGSLIPTTAQQPAIELGAAQPPATFPQSLPEPTRPQSPRGR